MSNHIYTLNQNHIYIFIAHICAFFLPVCTKYSNIKQNNR